MIPTATIDKLDATWRSLAELGATLDEGQWKLPTDVPGWNVQDNLAHLVGFERILQGLPETEHRVEPPAWVRNEIGAFNEHEVDARRHLHGADVLTEWEELIAARIATLRGGDDDYFASIAVTPIAQAPVAAFLEARVVDAWMHEQDIRRAVGAPGNLDTPAAGHVVEWFVRALPKVAARVGLANGTVVSVQITGGVQRTAVVHVGGMEAALVDIAPEPPAATIMLDNEVFSMLAGGRASYADVAERVTITGDRQVGERLLDDLNVLI